MKQGIIIWFTGMSGSGKSTLANMLNEYLLRENRSVKMLNGDKIRGNIHKDLHISQSDIMENNYRIIEMCKTYYIKYDFVLISVIAPFKETREYAKQLFGKSYIEVYCSCSIDVLKKRDTKGLYKRVIDGKLSNLIGLSKSLPYQIPTNPDLVLETDKFSKIQAIEYLKEFLKSYIM